MWRLSFCLPEPTHAPSLVQVMAPEKRKQIECGSGNERDQVRASLPSPSCLPRVLTTSPRPMYLRQARAALASDVACKLPVNERNVTIYTVYLRIKREAPGFADYKEAFRTLGLDRNKDKKMMQQIRELADRASTRTLSDFMSPVQGPAWLTSAIEQSLARR